MRLAAVLLSVSLASVPGTSRAAGVALTMPRTDPWDASFSPDVLATYLDADDLAVLAVAAGDSVAARNDAARSFMRALRRSGRARVVMDAAALGDVSSLGDPEIVARAGALPIDRIVVLRVTGEGDAMFSVYDKQGQRISGAAVHAGAALVPNGDGLSSTALPDAPDGEAPAPPPDAIDAYEREYLHLERLVAVTSYGDRAPSVRVFSVVYRGRHDAPVKGRELYRILERPDLERKYRRRMGVKIGAMAGGGVAGLGLMGAGLGVFLSNSRAARADFGSDDLLGQGKEEAGLRMSNGGAMALLGVGAGLLVTGTLIGVFLRAHPVDEAEAAELIDKYNRGLRKKLGIPAAYRGPSAARASVRVRLAAGRSGGRVSVSGRF